MDKCYCFHMCPKNECTGNNSNLVPMNAHLKISIFRYTKLTMLVNIQEEGNNLPTTVDKAQNWWTS